MTFAGGPLSNADFYGLDQLKGGPADFAATTVVGDRRPETSEPFTWVMLDNRVREWAEEVKRDVDTPDLSQGL